MNAIEISQHIGNMEQTNRQLQEGAFYLRKGFLDFPLRPDNDSERHHRKGEKQDYLNRLMINRAMTFEVIQHRQGRNGDKLSKMAFVQGFGDTCVPSGIRFVVTAVFNRQPERQTVDATFFFNGSLRDPGITYRFHRG